MLVATLEDLQGSVEVVVFPKVFEQTAQAWADDSVVLVTGRIDRRDETPQILCESVHQWDGAVQLGPAAFGAERDRLLGARGGRRWEKPAERAQGVWGGGPREAIAVEAPTVPSAFGVAVAVAEPEVVVAAVATAVGAPEPAEEPPAPVDAVPIQSAPEASAATVSVSIGDDVPMDRLLAAIESVKGALVSRPGPLPVLMSISVAGAVRQVRLPDRVAWDDRLGEAIRRAAGVPVAVELRSSADERLA